MLYDIDVTYDNGTTETIENVEKYSTACDGLFFKIDILGRWQPLIVPARQITRIATNKNKK